MKPTVGECDRGQQLTGGHVCLFCQCTNVRDSCHVSVCRVCTPHASGQIFLD